MGVGWPGFTCRVASKSCVAPHRKNRALRLTAETPCFVFWDSPKPLKKRKQDIDICQCIVIVFYKRYYHIHIVISFHSSVDWWIEERMKRLWVKGSQTLIGIATVAMHTLMSSRALTITTTYGNVLNVVIRIVSLLIPSMSRKKIFAISTINKEGT